MSPTVRYAPVFCRNGKICLQTFYTIVTAIFRRESPNGGVKCKGHEKNHDFWPTYRFISEMIQDSYYGRWIGNRTQAFEWYHFQWPRMTLNPDFKVTISFNGQITRKWYKIDHRATLTMANQWKLIYGLLNGAIVNDLERPQTKISRSRHYLTLNISETVRDTDIVTTTGTYALLKTFILNDR